MNVRNDHSLMPNEWVAGMSLRDWFAGQALPAVMARMHEDIQHLGSPTFPSNVSGHAYRIADAMLAERDK